MCSMRWWIMSNICSWNNVDLIDSNGKRRNDALGWVNNKWIYIPSVAFNNFGHVSSICWDKYVTFYCNMVIYCCHLVWMVLEGPKVQWIQECLLPHLFHMKKKKKNTDVCKPIMPYMENKLCIGIGLFVENG